MIKKNQKLLEDCRLSCHTNDCFCAVINYHRSCKCNCCSLQFQLRLFIKSIFLDQRLLALFPLVNVVPLLV